MVAISVYKGNLHKVPDVPRKWLMPVRKITLKDFKILTKRRSRALARLSSTPSTPSTAIAATSNPEITKLEDAPPAKEVEKKLDDAVCVEKQEETNTEGFDVIPSLEIDKKEDAVSDKEKRRLEIEERLQILTEKKHSLVQILKQILNAEEELKRRSIMQGTAIHPPVALQVDTTPDSGSMSRHHTPRMACDRNASGEVEGGETNDVNHNLLSRHLVHTSSPSPTSQSQQRIPAFNTAVTFSSVFNTAVQQTSRTNSGMANSPSGFALTGQQGNPSNLQSVSLSGTDYVASSPSPAASGGTSAFRDGRISRPWT